MLIPNALADPAQVQELRKTVIELLAKATEISAALSNNIPLPCSCHMPAPRPVAFLPVSMPRSTEVTDDLLQLAMKRLRAQTTREKFLPAKLLRDAGWNMLLDLFVSKLRGKSVTVSSACLASGGAPTTALRWLAVLEQQGMIVRVQDETDTRRVFVAITDMAYDSISRWLRHTN